MLRSRRYPELAPLDGDDSVNAHDSGDSVLGTVDTVFIIKLIPYPGATVVTIVLQKDPLYFNEQLLVLDSMLTFRSILERVIPAPRYFQRPAHLWKRKLRTVLIYKDEPFSVCFENMPTAFFKMSRSISTSLS